MYKQNAGTPFLGNYPTEKETWTKNLLVKRYSSHHYYHGLTKKYSNVQKHKNG